MNSGSRSIRKWRCGLVRKLRKKNCLLTQSFSVLKNWHGIKLVGPPKLHAWPTKSGLWMFFQQLLLCTDISPKSICLLLRNWEMLTRLRLRSDKWITTMDSSPTCLHGQSRKASRNVFQKSSSLSLLTKRILLTSKTKFVSLRRWGFRSASSWRPKPSWRSSASLQS